QDSQTVELAACGLLTPVRPELRRVVPNSETHAIVTRMLLLLILHTLGLAATIEIYPATHSRVFSPNKEPVARIKSGDTVITRTWDSGGADWKGVKHIQHPYVYPETGNPLMGPFYIEGAELGDSIEVHLR